MRLILILSVCLRLLVGMFNQTKLSYKSFLQVGYGDILPVTNAAKFLAVVSALCGVLVFGLPIPLIVQGFSKFYGVVNNKSSRVLMKAKGQAKTKREAN